jgi:hypothetical protein
LGIIQHSRSIHKAFCYRLYSTFVFEALIAVFKNWSEYRPTAKLIIKYTEESITKISQEFLAELIKYSKEN